MLHQQGNRSLVAFLRHQNPLLSKCSTVLDFMFVDVWYANHKAMPRLGKWRKVSFSTGQTLLDVFVQPQTDLLHMMVMGGEIAALFA